MSLAVACAVYVSNVEVNRWTVTVRMRGRTDGRHVAQNLGAINPYPVKCRVWENVDIIPIGAGKSPHANTPREERESMHPPAQLLREKVIHARASDDLGQRTRQAETIWEPCDATPQPKARLEVTLAKDELS